MSVVETSTTVNLGGTITFSATVTGFAGAVAPSATNSTWVITGVPGVSACTTTTGPNAGSNSYSSTYTCSVTASLAGTYGANFTFPGDSSYNPAATASSTTTQQTLPATPSVVITSTSTPTLGGSLIFTTTVTGSANAVAPSGASGTMSYAISITTTAGTSSGSCNEGAGSTVGTSSGVVTTYTCTVATPTVGSYSVTPTFNSAGTIDPNYTVASAAALIKTVLIVAPTITLAQSSSPTLGQPMTLTATVTGASTPGAAQPSAGVSFAITDPSGRPL